MSKPVRLIILTEYFYPDIASTGQLLTELAIALRDRGCHVAVLTSKPSYAAKRDARQFESYRGLQITRCFRTRFSKNSLLGKVANTVSFFFSVLVRLLFREGDIPLLIVSNPAVLPLVGYVLSVLRGQPYVALVHDIFPDIAVALGYLRPSSLITRCWNVVNQLMLKRAAQVITLSKTMCEGLLRKMTIDGSGASNHVVVIHNWADETFIRPIAKAESPFALKHRIVDKFVMLHSGNIGLSYDFETVIGAAGRLQGMNFLFLFIGEGGQKLRLMHLVRERNLSNVRFMPYQPWEELPFSLTAADVSLITIEKGLNGLAMPSKLYTIMASGRPIIAIVDDDSDTARIIREADCGIVIPQDRISAQARIDTMVGALVQLKESPELCREMGANGRRFLEQHFTLRRAAAQYYCLFEQLNMHSDLS